MLFSFAPESCSPSPGFPNRAPTGEGSGEIADELITVLNRHSFHGFVYQHAWFTPDEKRPQGIVVLVPHSVKVEQP
jgi:hypothetical protein